MELPTSNRKKVIDIWLTGLVAKIDPFSILWKVISRKPLDLHRWKFAVIFFQALSASVPNFIEIGGGSRKFSKKLVDLTRNDPKVFRNGARTSLLLSTGVPSMQTWPIIRNERHFQLLHCFYWKSVWPTHTSKGMSHNNNSKGQPCSKTNQECMGIWH